MKKILIFIAFSAMFFLPASAMAAGDYSCWCGDTANGAQKTPMQLPDDVSAGSLKNDCIEFCEASNMDFVVFTNDANLEPGANLRCWRADECAEKDGVWRTEQASDCKQGYHYCDVKPTPIPLTVAIGREGTVTSVESLGDYVNAFYEWAFYAALIIAVVMVMIGGVQYMVGKGSGDVQKAKSRIYNAVVGVVILLSAYTILATVNPALINLEMPSIPKIKTVLYVDADSWCEALIDAGYSVEYKNQVLTAGALYSGACGDKGEVVEGPSGAETTIEECYFSECADGKTCLRPNDQNEAPFCLGCRDIGPGGDPNAPTAAPEICSQIGLQKISQSLTTYCFHSYDLGLAPTRAGIVTEGTCAEVEVLCDYGKVKSCRDLDKLVVYAATDQENIECTNGPGAPTFSLAGDPSIAKDVCENYDKYCPGMNVAPPGESCKFITTQGNNDILGKSAEPWQWYAGMVSVGLLSGPAAIITVPAYVSEASDEIWQWDCVNSGFVKVVDGKVVESCFDKDYSAGSTGDCDDDGVGECGGSITR